MSNQLCIVLDFGGQYNQLIARRVRECGVYCEIKRFDTPISEIKAMNPTAIIFTGGPNSVYAPYLGGDIQYRRTDPRYLLRMSAHGVHSRRQGREL